MERVAYAVRKKLAYTERYAPRAEGGFRPSDGVGLSRNALHTTFRHLEIAKATTAPSHPFDRRERACGSLLRQISAQNRSLKDDDPSPAHHSYSVHTYIHELRRLRQVHDWSKRGKADDSRLRGQPSAKKSQRILNRRGYPGCERRWDSGERPE